VGNILNSISFSSEHIHEITQKSSCLSLPGIVDLIEKHSDNPGEFFTNDPKGKQLPLYFSKLSDQLTKEQDILLNECRRQLKHIHLVAEIIRTQQDTAKEGRLSEQIDITDILEECLQVFKQQIRDNEIAIERKYTKLPEMYGERYKILQIINNLISNAIDAFDKQEQQNKTLSQERNEAIEELIHSKKIETIGILANGLAHDFNNLLMGIQGNIELGSF